MKPALFLRLSVCFLAALLFSGCAGYHMGASKPKYMADIQTIAVLPFKNASLEPRVEIQGANALIKQFQVDGTYKVLPADSADAIFQGTIAKIDREPARSVRGNVLATREFELVIKVTFEVKRRTTRATIESREVEGRTSFFVGGDLQQQERQAIPLALENAAEQIVSLLSEGW